MQHEEKIGQGRPALSENEISFAKSLDHALELALGDPGAMGNVTSIWSHLKDEQRARLAMDYLSSTSIDTRQNSISTFTESSPRTSPETSPGTSPGTTAAGMQGIAPETASAFVQGVASPMPPEAGAAPAQPAPQMPQQPQQQQPPRGYPAGFNPLAGLPGLEPDRSGPSPVDIIAGSLSPRHALPAQALSASPADGTPNGDAFSQSMQRSMQNALSLLGGLAMPGYPLPGFPAQGRADMPPPPAPSPAASPAPSPASAPYIDHTATDFAGADFATDALIGAAAATLPAAPNFWPLWMDQQDSLLKQCLKLMSGNMDDAQDALSEAMIKASVKFEDSIDEIRNHRAWLSRIVHNACIDLHRQNRRKAEYKEESHGTYDATMPPVSGRNEPNPEESFMATEMFGHLETALRALPDKLRKPLLMRCLEDRSYDDIADDLGLSNCAVRKRVQLARDQLRDSGLQ